MDFEGNYLLFSEINVPNSFKIWNYSSLGDKNVNKFEFWREGPRYNFVQNFQKKPQFTKQIQK